MPPEPTTGAEGRPLRISRRRVLAVAGGAGLGIVIGVWAPGALSEPAPASLGKAFLVKAPARLPLLIDPNKAEQIEVSLPLGALGGVTSTTILPLGRMATRLGYEWRRVIWFRQPLSGGPVNPNLRNVAGRLPRWGSMGPGSVDVVEVGSSNGSDWSLRQAHPVAVSTPRSVLDTSSPTPGLGPFDLPNVVLVWTAVDALRSVGPLAMTPGDTVGMDYSGSGNDLLVNVGETVAVLRRALPRGRRPVAVSTPGLFGMGCAFAGGPFSAWSVVIAVTPGQPSTAGLAPPVFSFRAAPATTGLSSAPALHAPIREPTVLAVSSGSGVLMATGSNPIGPSLLPVLPSPSAPVAGIDLPNAFGIAGVLVFASSLSPPQLTAAAQRLQWAAFGSLA